MVRVAQSFNPVVLDPFFAPLAAAQTQGSGVPPLDTFGGGPLSPGLAAFMTGAGGIMLDPAMMLASMGALPGGDAGQLGADQGFGAMYPATWGVGATEGIQGASREELESAIKEMFAELNQMGLPLEARPGSQLAEAMANGDFSNVNPQDLAALLIALALFGQNRNNPGQVAQQGNMPFAPRGSWNPATGGNSFGGGTQHTGANAPAATATGPAPTGRAPSSAGAFAGRIGDAAESVANSMGSTGWCYKGVATALAREGVTVTGGSAYMAADQLAGMPDKFQEVSVSPDQLDDLPRGAVVVWGKTGASPHGHISVALGDGREASDHVQNQITSLRGASNYRVFIPRG